MNNKNSVTDYAVASGLSIFVSIFTVVIYGEYREEFGEFSYLLLVAGEFLMTVGITLLLKGVKLAVREALDEKRNDHA